jgi:hypothetical protein
MDPTTRSHLGDIIISPDNNDNQNSLWLSKLSSSCLNELDFPPFIDSTDSTTVLATEGNQYLNESDFDFGRPPQPTHYSNDLSDPAPLMDMYRRYLDAPHVTGSTSSAADVPFLTSNQYSCPTPMNTSHPCPNSDPCSASDQYSSASFVSTKDLPQSVDASYSQRSLSVEPMRMNTATPIARPFTSIGVDVAWENYENQVPLQMVANPYQLALFQGSSPIERCNLIQQYYALSQQQIMPYPKQQHLYALQMQVPNQQFPAVQQQVQYPLQHQMQQLQQLQYQKQAQQKLMESPCNSALPSTTDTTSTHTANCAKNVHAPVPSYPYPRLLGSMTPPPSIDTSMRIRSGPRSASCRPLSTLSSSATPSLYCPTPKSNETISTITPPPQSPFSPPEPYYKNLSDGNPLKEVMLPSDGCEVETIRYQDRNYYAVTWNDVKICRRVEDAWVNMTKLLNAAKLTRGQRDNMLKKVKTRFIQKEGNRTLKGVWYVNVSNSLRVHSKCYITHAFNLF